ncbi:hypothetical protein [Ruminococcus sp.]|uniref:hypothetical protein n=1 Tax=Ruminococcus sp. TaxID=41978 RepID=UPI0039926437
MHFFDGITSLMQLMVFFLLGLLCTPSRMLSVALPALLIAVFLTFLARPVVVALLLTPFRAKLPPTAPGLLGRTARRHLCHFRPDCRSQRCGAAI